MRKAGGFMLIEILVTITVVSFGLLAVAGIIANGLKNDLSSYSRSQASALVNDIIDRMRANRGTAEAAGLPYNLTMGATPGGTGIPKSDLTDWVSSLSSTLPSGQGSVAIDATTKKVTVTVQWDDSRAAGGGSTQQFIVETRL